MPVAQHPTPPRDLSFPATRRLKNPADFRHVFKTGLRVADESFTLLAARNALEIPRLGLAISRRTSRSAVQRNRIKRLIRESFRCHRSGLPAVDIVVMSRPGCAGRSSADLVGALEALWQKLKRRCDAH